jgi:hypothetical protein
MDSQTIAARGLKRACSIFRQDLEALPEEAFGKQFGGKSRTVADIVYEVNLVNDHVGLTMREEELFDWPEGWIKAPVELNTKEAALAAFDESSCRIMETVEGFSNDQWNAPLETDDGVTDRFERCRFMTLHLWYHSGQLNFIQTLMGDDAWHWK